MGIVIQFKPAFKNYAPTRQANVCKVIDFRTGKEIFPEQKHHISKELSEFCSENLPLNKNNHARFYALLKRLPYAVKEQLVYESSRGKTESLTEFFQSDKAGYENMLAQMQKMADGTPVIVNATIKVANEQTRKLRSGVLKRMQKYGVDTSELGEINRFLLQPRIAGKLLYQMDDSELQQLIKKLNAILKKTKLI